MAEENTPSKNETYLSILANCFNSAGPSDGLTTLQMGTEEGVRAGDQARRQIYRMLATHQRNETWTHKELIGLLQWWTVVFNVEFKLDVPEVVLCLERLSANRYGHFRPGHNGYGLRGEIAINTLYLFEEREVWEILGTLLHELLHAWQQAHGTPSRGNHHNAEFRQKALGLGLDIDAKGVTGFAADSPFKMLLAQYGVPAPAEATPRSSTRKRGDSKLKKWSCGCTSVRVAVTDFKAQCLKCNEQFEPDDSYGRRSKSSTSRAIVHS